MDSPLFPFASCAFQAPCWAPNRRLLHSGPIPYSHPPTARSQVPLHLLPTHRTQLPKRVRGVGGGLGMGEPPLPTLPGVKMALTLTSPHHKLPFKSPPPQRALFKACVRDIQCGGLNRELVSGSGTPPFILPTPSPTREAHARSLGQRPSLSWRWRVGEEEHCPPLDGSETWDEADTKIREY